MRNRKLHHIAAQPLDTSFVTQTDFFVLFFAFFHYFFSSPKNKISPIFHIHKTNNKGRSNNSFSN